jgi:hypothetical protein
VPLPHDVRISRKRSRQFDNPLKLRELGQFLHDALPRPTLPRSLPAPSALSDRARADLDAPHLEEASSSVFSASQVLIND